MSSSQLPPPPYSSGTATASPRFIALDGGLNLKQDPIIVQPPQVTTAQNIWTMTPGQIRSLPIVQQGNYSSAATYPIYGLYEHIPTDPYTTGDIVVHTELTESGNSFTMPGFNSGTGFNPPGNLQTTPVIPYVASTRPFASAATTRNASLANFNPTSYLSPVWCVSATLPIGVYAVPTIYDGNINDAWQYTLYMYDFTGNTIIGTANISYAPNAFSYPGLDIIESTTAGTFLVVNTGGLSSSDNAVTIRSISQTNSVVSLGTAYAINIITGNAVQPWQLVNFNSQPYVVYGASSTGALTATAINPTSAGTSHTIGSATTTGAIAAWVGGSTLFIVYPGHIIAANTSFTAGTAVAFTAPGSSTYSVTGAAQAGFGCFWYNEAFSGSASGSEIAFNVVAPVSQRFTYSGTTITLVDSYTYSNQAGACLASKGISIGTTGACVLIRSGAMDLGAVANSYAQPTYYLIDAKCRIIARVYEGAAPNDQTLVQVGGGNGSKTFAWAGQLPTPQILLNPVAGNVSTIAFMLWRNVVEGFNQGPWTTAQLNNSTQSVILGSVGAPNIVSWQPSLLTLSERENLGNPGALTAGRSEVMPGGLTMLYTTNQAVEAGWHEYPHFLTTNGSAGSGSNNPAGTYLYRAIYRWQDANGQIHRSSPSPVLSVTQGSTWNSQSIQVPLPPFTFRTLTPFYIELYRTDNAGTVFYLVGQSPTYYGTSASLTNGTGGYLGMYTFITDSSYTTASANFGVAYPAYWQSVPESSPPPSFIWQVMSQGRHFGLAQVDGGYRVYYTNIWTPGVTVEWNVNGYLQVPPELGDCRSMTAQDSNVFVFGTQGVGVFNGNGPAQALGTDGIDYNINDPSFSNIVPIPNAAGVVGTGCPVQIPTGIMYQSSQSFLLIGRDLSSQFAGQMVDVLSGVYGQTQTVYGQSILLPKLQMILFTNPSGDSLLYDYNLSRWTLWPAAIVGPISGAVQRRDGTIYLAQQLVSGSTLPQTFTLNGSSVNCGISALYQSSVTPLATTTGYTAPQIEVETPWLFTGQVPGGDGEFWEAGILGTYYAPHQLKVELAFNYQGYGLYSGDTQTFNVTAQPYPSYQFRIRPPGTARCWAVRFRITILPPSGFSYSTPTPDFARITGIMLFGAAQQGNTRLGPGVSR